ncbi:NERD domain-containing protein [Pseudarthrobacter sp. DSP2-3-2b1]|uniref:nuclease-related domain-containing DEAD/DEAH box helicase n=1 Tax=Pseudarthrobacter sp. DSP2-3-2b1 TaxID=2804661 RepID=UPI003CF10F53
MRLIPPAEYIDAQSPAERKIAELLTAIRSDDGVAYHSVHLPRHRKQVMGEADFVVLWKGTILVLEVKGGRIGRTEDGLWYSMDRQGIQHPLRRSPWVQAKDASFALLDILTRQFDESGWPFAYAVVTPDQNLTADAEWVPQQHIGLDRMTPAGLERSLDALARLARTPPSDSDYSLRQGLRPMANLSTVVTHLRRQVDAMRTVPDTEMLIDRNIVTMTDEQVDAMRAFERNPRVLVLGGAGTGKTVVAIEAARRAVADGSSVAFVCGSPGVLRFASELLSDCPVQVVPFDSIPGDPVFDVVVVDEAQDLLNLEDMSRLSESVRGGLQNGRWWIFLDPNNQTHLIGVFDEMVYQEIQTGAIIVDLTKNVRNARTVVTAVQSHLGADLGSPRIGEGPDASIVQARTPEEARRLLDGRLSTLRDQGVSRKKITIISAAADPSASILAIEGRPPANYTMENQSYEVVTAANIKGLEREHVIVMDVADLDTTGGRAGSYVAMTRPRYSLYVISSPGAYQIMGRNALQYIQKQVGKAGARNE